MIRKLLYHLVPFLIPFVVYAVYMVATKRAQSKGKVFNDAPWYWLIAIGLSLSVLSILIYWYFNNEPIGGSYIPPRLENGEIVPGKIIR